MKNRASCAHKRTKTRKHATELKLFLATGPLAQASIDNRSPFMESNNGDIAFLVVANQFSKLAKTVPLRTTTAQNIATAFKKMEFFVRPTKQASRQ